MAGPPVAVAIVNWNTRDLLDACLRSVHDDVDRGEAEAIVVDNASTDGSAAHVAERFSWATLITSDSNLGFGPAINLAATRTAAPWLLVTNADVELTAGALHRLRATAEADPRTAVVAPRLLLDDGTIQHSAYRFPTLGFTLAFNLGLARPGSDRARRMLLEGSWDGAAAGPVDWALGACLLIRRSAFDAIGGFDPGQWMYAEDLDLGWRLAEQGWQTRFEPAATVRHRWAAATTQAWGEGRDARAIRSTYAWLLRRRGATAMRTTALINTAGAGSRALAASAGALLARRDDARGLRAWQLRRVTRHHAANLVARRATLARHR